MPLYEYQCDACGHRFEVIRKFSDPPIEVCPKCGGHVQKLVASPAFQFKGTGWYITDYAKKDGASGGKSSSPDTEKKPSSSDAKETSTKTDSGSGPASSDATSAPAKTPTKD